MKKTLWIILLCLVIFCLWYFYFFTLSWFTYKTNKNLIKQKIPYNSTTKYLYIRSWSEFWKIDFLLKELRNITKLHIKINKDSLHSLDFSKLQTLKTLQELEIYTIYKNWDTVIRDQSLTIKWLDTLFQLHILSVHDLPLVLLDMHSLPPNLTRLSLYNIRVEKIITGDLVSIPNVFINISWPQWWTYSVNSWTRSKTL